MKDGGNVMGLLEKMKDITDTEIIGELDGVEEKEKNQREPKAKKGKAIKQKPARNPKPKKEKPKKQPKEKKGGGFLSNLFKKKDEFIDENEYYAEQDNDMFNDINNEEDDIDPSKYIKTDVAGGRSRNMIMNEFGVSVGPIMPADLPSAEDVDSVRFAVTVPSGFDTGEVDEFVDMMVVTVSGYRKELVKQSDINQKLVDEILRLDRQALDQRNQETLDSFIAQGSNERERLQNQLVDIQLKNNDLERQLNSLTKGEVITSSVNVEKLEAENTSLKATVSELQSKLSNLQSNGSEYNSDEIEQKLQDALRLNEELSNEVMELRAGAPANKSTENEEELLLEIARLREENERLLAKKDEEVVERIEESQPIKIKVDETIKSMTSSDDDNSNAFKQLYEAMDEGGDAEEEALKKIEAQASSKSKRAKRALTEEDIDRIKRAEEEKVDIVPDVSTGDDMMDRMLAEMNS